MGTRAVVGTVVVLAVLVGGAAVADGVVRERTEDQLATDLRTEIAGLDAEPDVEIHGFPFLTQVLAGELDDVRLSAPALTVDGVVLEDVDVRLRGVGIEQPTTARQAELTASLPLASMRDAVTLPVELDVRDGTLVAAGDVLGVPLEAALVPQAQGRAIGIELVELTLGGLSIDPDGLPAALRTQLGEISVPVEGLPPGVEISDVTVTADGVDLTAVGEDVVLDADQLE